MPAGISDKFDILKQSPHDCHSSAHTSSPTVIPHWVPSRYNIRAVAEDGRLLLWNTLSGKLTAFKAQDREVVVRLLKREGFEAPKEKFVKYLVDRGYLVRKGVNEYRQFQQLFGEQHYRSDALELILMASEDCNFRCTYCYEDFTRGTMTPEVRESVKNLVRRRIRKLNRLSIGWFGGEPLYGWEAVKDLAPFFVEMADEHEVPYTSNMTTNGYLLTPDVADQLLAWRIRNFQVTLDGLPEHHNHSRPGRDGSSTFERIFDNLKALARREDEFYVRLRINFDKVNSGSLPQLMELLAEEFRNDPRYAISLHAVGKWGGPNDTNLEVCGVEDTSRIRRDLQAEIKRQGLGSVSLRNTLQAGSEVCYAARPYNFLIGATGKVMKCTVVLDKDDYNVVGQLTPEGEIKLDNDRMALWTEPAFEQDSQCRKCVILPTCQGLHCPLVRIEENTQPCTPVRSRPKVELLATLDQ